MAVKWDELFGADFYFMVTNEERKYLALNPLEQEWDMTQYTSKTNLWHKRTTAFWCGDTIKKVILEYKKVSRKDGRIVYDSITEYDTELQTEHRQWLIPRTSRGKKKKITATNILNMTPLGCEFHFHRDTYENVLVNMSIYNGRNYKKIAIGEWDRIREIKNHTDFHEFMKYYMDTCPPDYFEKIKQLREGKHVTVRYQTGDIFRMEMDRFHFCYGIITGQVKHIQKWEELPENHSLRKIMMVPIMVRYYQVVTTDATWTQEELSKYSLGRVEICGDNDVIWGTHPIVGHKELEEGDIEFDLVCTKIQDIGPHDTVHTYDMLVSEGMVQYPDTYHLYVEWGTATTILDSEKISPKLREYMKEYRSPHGGVAMGIGGGAFHLLHKGDNYHDKYNLLNDVNTELRQELFRCLGLEPDVDFDGFAKAFGGLTKEELLERKW